MLVLTLQADGGFATDYMGSENAQLKTISTVEC